MLITGPVYTTIKTGSNRTLVIIGSDAFMCRNVNPKPLLCSPRFSCPHVGANRATPRIGYTLMLSFI